MAKKAHRIGPYSRENALTCIDGRTREGRFLQAIQAELTEHVGGLPSAAERILIKVAALKTLRVALKTAHGDPRDVDQAGGRRPGKVVARKLVSVNDEGQRRPYTRISGERAVPQPRALQRVLGL